MVDEAGEGEPRRRLAVIEVEKLFGLYDHRIELNLEERVTILHGPNGVGKTMLLRMVDAALKGDFDSLYGLPFGRLTLGFSDDSSLSFDWQRAETQPRPLWVAPIGTVTVQVHGAEEMADLTATLEIYENVISEAPPWLLEYGSSINAGHHIEVERLRWETRRESKATAVAYAEELAERIEEVQARYGRRSQELDQSYPQRLVRAESDDGDPESLRARMQALDDRRVELERLGLLGDTSQQPFDLDALRDIEPAKRSVIALYASDTAEKLAVFDDLAGRLRLFLDILNTKLRHKRVRADRARGLVIEPHGYDGPPIPLDALSSGEQHELVVHYDLLFRIRPDTLVLIDEPELSLHVIWQKRFMHDLLRIIDVAGIDVLVATHSPYIIGEHRDLMVGLSDELP